MHDGAGTGWDVWETCSTRRTTGVTYYYYSLLSLTISSSSYYYYHYYYSSCYRCSSDFQSVIVYEKAFEGKYFQLLLTLQ